MQRYTKEQRRVIGSTLIGCTLVLGAFIIQNQGHGYPAPSARVQNVEAVLAPKIDREFIPTTDSNNDGVEDWREEFVVQAPIILPAGTSTAFELPTTTTDLIGIQVFQSFLMSKTDQQPPFSNDEIAAKSTAQIANLVTDELYTMNDVVTVATDPITIRRYGNAMGQSLITHNVESANELEIVSVALQTNNEDELKKLVPLANMYRKLRDDALNTPVPERFAENHLNLINAYHTLYRDLSDFQLVFSDPMIALLRFKRYQDDTAALGIILNTMYRASAPYHSLFMPEDPALVFIAFSTLP